MQMSPTWMDTATSQIMGSVILQAKPRFFIWLLNDNPGLLADLGNDTSDSIRSRGQS